MEARASLRTSELNTGLRKLEANSEGAIAPNIIEKVNEGWVVDFGDGEKKLWSAITGPNILSKREWIGWTGKFLGLNDLNDTQLQQIGEQEVSKLFASTKDEVARLSNKYLVPHVSDEGGYESQNKRLIMHGATPANGNYKAEYERLAHGQKSFSYDTWTGGRAGFFAKSGDMVVGRGLEKVIAQLPGVELVEADNKDFYYTYEAIAKWANDDPEFQNVQNPIPKIVKFLNENPEASISIYASGFEEQAVLLYLRSQTDHDKLRVEANSPEANKLNNKQILYGELNTLLESVPEREMVTHQDVIDMVKEEKQFSKLGSLIGDELADIFAGTPGCYINCCEDYDGYLRDVKRLREYFFDRYGITKIVAKPSVASDGERIVFDIDPRDGKKLANLAQELYETGDVYVFEPQLSFTKYRIGDEVRSVVPSSHVFAGHALEGIGMNQKIYKKGIWGGHDILDRRSAKQLGMTDMLTGMNKYMKHIADKSRDMDLGLSLAGIDFFEALVESENPLVASTIWRGPGDPNIRVTGALYTYASFEKVADEFEQKSGKRPVPGDVSVSTRVFLPLGDYGDINEAVMEFKKKNGQMTDKTTFGTVAVGKDNWGMIYASGRDVNKSAQNVEDLLDYLSHRGLRGEL